MEHFTYFRLGRHIKVVYSLERYLYGLVWALQSVSVILLSLDRNFLILFLFCSG